MNGLNLIISQFTVIMNLIISIISREQLNTLLLCFSYQIDFVIVYTVDENARLQLDRSLQIIVNFNCLEMQQLEQSSSPNEQH